MIMLAFTDEMDGMMQDGYEHCLPKVKKVQGLRSALIFRQGRVAAVHDSGNRVVDIAEGRPILAPPAALPTIIGHPPNSTNIIEGHDSYSRADLFLTRVHRCDRRGVCGNIESGAESIVVSRQDSALREEDGLQWIKYTSSRRQGGGGFATSFKKKQPIRVFRSSSLNNKYAPPPRPLGNTSYRYDGLYRVLFMWDEEGNRVEEGPAPNGAQFTFLLRRLPKVAGGDVVVGNNLSTDELWRKICERKGETVRPFVPIQPTTHLDELPLLPPTNRHRKAAGEKFEGKSVTPSGDSAPFHAVAAQNSPKEKKVVLARDKESFDKWLSVRKKQWREAWKYNQSEERNIIYKTDGDDDGNEMNIDINWVQCDECNKWRILREGAVKDSPDSLWVCSMNTSDPYRSNCEAPEEDEDDYIQSFEDEYEKDDDDDDDYYVPPPTLAQIKDIMSPGASDGKDSRKICSDGSAKVCLKVRTGGQGRPFSSEVKLPAETLQQIGWGGKVTRELESSGLKKNRKRKQSEGSEPRKCSRLNSC